MAVRRGDFGTAARDGEGVVRHNYTDRSMSALRPKLPFNRCSRAWLSLRHTSPREPF